MNGQTFEEWAESQGIRKTGYGDDVEWFGALAAWNEQKAIAESQQCTIESLQLEGAQQEQALVRVIETIEGALGVPEMFDGDASVDVLAMNAAYFVGLAIEQFRIKFDHDAGEFVQLENVTCST